MSEEWDLAARKSAFHRYGLKVKELGLTKEQIDRIDDLLHDLRRCLWMDTLQRIHFTFAANARLIYELHESSKYAEREAEARALEDVRDRFLKPDQCDITWSGEAFADWCDARAAALRSAREGDGDG